MKILFVKFYSLTINHRPDQTQNVFAILMGKSYRLSHKQSEYYFLHLIDSDFSSLRHDLGSAGDKTAANKLASLDNNMIEFNHKT